MAGSAVALALAAAVLHAVWNLLLARAPDTDAATAAALAIGVGLYAVPALLTWHIDAAAWPFIAASAAFELGYVITLARGSSAATSASSTRWRAARRRCSCSS